MEEMRKQFEDWRVKDVPFSLLGKDERGEYQDIATWLAWRAWQASRAALVVNIKQFDEFQICHYGASEEYAKGYIDAQNNSNKGLLAAGITVKEK